MNSLLNYSTPFYALWLIFVCYFFVSAWGNKATAFRVKRTWRLVYLLGIIALIWFLSLDSGFLNLRLLEWTPATGPVALALCAAGIFFAIWARRTLATNWSLDPTIKESHELVQKGPYRLVRHPIYTGILLALFGTELAGGRMKNAIVFLFALATFLYKMRVEESLMMRQFPQAYPAYKGRTKALVPFVI
jgi:protein-S-isoprenylcysteine O-methyltransferase Ste14